jgi:hypothetical protein
LLRIPEVSSAFQEEARVRGIDLVVASGTALDGALALGLCAGRRVGEMRQTGLGCALRARSPYLLMTRPIGDDS